jgi:hypothetical protein
MADEHENWPPARADEYFRGEAFGRLMLEVVQFLTKRYSRIDFTDAVATAFVWFARRGEQDSGFLRSGKFPNPNAFRAYVRQSLWNAARAAARNRLARQKLQSPVQGTELVSPDLSPLWLAAFHECRDRLPDPFRRVFDLMQDEDDPPGGLSRDQWAATILDWDAERVDRAYKEACHRIRQCMEKGTSATMK